MVRMLGSGLLVAAVLVSQPVSAEPREFPAVVADSSLAAFNTCYATLGNSGLNPGALIRIDLATGAGTLIGPTGIVGGTSDRGVPALAIRSNGVMYAADIGSPSNLYRLDAKSGAPTLIGPTGLTSIPAMVFGGFGILYVADAAGNLHTMDPTTATPTLVGATGLTIRGLAVDPTSGDLWASDASSKIYKIDNQTAGATLVGDTGRPPSPDLCFDQAGNLFAVSGGGLSTNNLLSIDKSTGAGTVIGPIGFPSVSGMAMRISDIVPTLVQGQSARWREGGVELRWRLSGNTGRIAFVIDRATETGGYERLDASSVEWDGTDFSFIDAAVQPGRTYRYRVAVLEDGAPATSFEASVTVPALAMRLEQNHPNPFGATTWIEFTIPRTARVTITVLDAAGRIIRVLADRHMGPGSHLEAWDGRDSRGARVGSGVYFYRLRSESRELTRTMLRLD